VVARKLPTDDDVGIAGDNCAGIAVDDDRKMPAVRPPPRADSDDERSDSSLLDATQVEMEASKMKRLVEQGMKCNMMFSVFLQDSLVIIACSHKHQFFASQTMIFSFPDLVMMTNVFPQFVSLCEAKGVWKGKAGALQRQSFLAHLAAYIILRYESGQLENFDPVRSNKHTYSLTDFSQPGSIDIQKTEKYESILYHFGVTDLKEIHRYMDRGNAYYFKLHASNGAQKPKEERTDYNVLIRWLLKQLKLKSWITKNQAQSKNAKGHNK
jgi:hypothetical protein